MTSTTLFHIHRSLCFEVRQIQTDIPPSSKWQDGVVFVFLPLAGYWWLGQGHLSISHTNLSPAEASRTACCLFSWFSLLPTLSFLFFLNYLFSYLLGGWGESYRHNLELLPHLKKAILASGGASLIPAQGRQVVLCEFETSSLQSEFENSQGCNTERPYLEKTNKKIITKLGHACNMTPWRILRKVSTGYIVRRNSFPFVECLSKPFRGHDGVKLFVKHLRAQD